MLAISEHLVHYNAAKLWAIILFMNRVTQYFSNFFQQMEASLACLISLSGFYR